jgi:hypothetical protein
VRHRLEVADVVRAHRADLVAARRGHVAPAETKVLDAVERCRTAALGGHVERCDRCGHEEISYNSCRNRHCPKCMVGARERWLAAREEDLLPIPYFHVVFSIPHELAALAQQNKKLVYGLLFECAWATLRAIAGDKKHLGAEIGVLAVLHTWGQTLEHHPHVHCVVTGGGIAPDGRSWVPCRNGFFLPVRVLGALFRGKFLHHLKRAFARSLLSLKGSLEAIATRSDFNAYLRPLYEVPWMVYAKPPFGGPAHVLKYLARYTHRVAIANSRLVALEAGRVSFLWKDYAHGCRRRVMSLSGVEFLRRFLLHILPKGFKRIRHYGILANRHHGEKLDAARRLLLSEAPSTAPQDAGVDTPEKPQSCPSCGIGTMLVIRALPALEQRPYLASVYCDTS